MTRSDINDGGWPAWRALAECACRGLPTELFYPASADPDRWDPRVLDTCATCPVRADCLAWAVGRGEYGIWAGTSEEQRARLRRAQQRKRSQK